MTSAPSIVIVSAPAPGSTLPITVPELSVIVSSSASPVYVAGDRRPIQNKRVRARAAPDFPSSSSLRSPPL